MEQFLLSSDVAVQQTAQAQSVTTKTTGNNEETFNPILEEAVAGQNSIANTKQEQTATTDSESGEGRAEHFVSSDLLNTVLQSQASNQLSINQESSQKSLNETSIKTSITPDPLQLDTSLQLNQSLQNNTDTSSRLPVTEAITETVVPISPSSPSNASKAETILLQQIQQIIDEGKNIGAITIKGENTTGTSAKEQIDNLQTLSSLILNETDPETIQVRQSNTIQILPGDQKTPNPNLTTTRPESGRQEITEQFLNAKFGESKTTGEQQTPNQQNDHQNSNGSDKSSNLNVNIATTAAVSDTSSDDTTFAQQLRSSDITTTTSTSSIEGKFAPGATQTAVPERELVDNLIHRFNVNPRLQTSKLTMQLHPAELGQIKIDILVKGDSISANIVAQSQQVIETLDKHMNRLRGVLEDQGFQVDSFNITLQTNEDTQQNLFQEHFDSQQFADNLKKPSVHDEDSFDVLLDSESTDTEQDESGLHVTA